MQKTTKKNNKNPKKIVSLGVLKYSQEQKDKLPKKEPQRLGFLLPNL